MSRVLVGFQQRCYHPKCLQVQKDYDRITKINKNLTSENTEIKQNLNENKRRIEHLESVNERLVEMYALYR